jgi:hypothetical protein
MKKLCFVVACLVALNVAVAHAAPGVLPAPGAQSFSVQLKNGGGFVLENGAKTYAVESNFSYPMMRDANWNALAASDEKPNDGEWKWSASQNKNGFTIEAVGKAYRLQRNVSLQNDHVVISDKFTNISKEDIAIAFDNKVTSLSAPRAINVSGVYEKSYFPYSSIAPPGNPTIFLDNENSGLGMIALDDIYRLQFSLKKDAQSGWFENRSFGLPAGDSYTFEWALYPTKSGDYYEFVNAARRDYVRPTRIEGGMAWLAINAPTTWPREQMVQWLRDRSAKIVILVGPYSGAPWLGGYAQYMNKVPVAYDEKAQLADIKKAREILREIDPTIKCLAPFETALTPDQPAGQSTPIFSDSLIIGENGKPQGYQFPKDAEKRDEYIQTKGHSYIYYPMAGNSYEKAMRATIEKALDETDCDGIYFDIFSYTAPDFRWTYDRWDNRTVNMDLTNYTIARKKADVELLSEDARADIVQMVLDRKKGNIVIANTMPVTAKIRALPIMHFTETIMDYGYMQSHFATPIVLGWTTGYSPGAEKLGKQGTWWKEWKTDADYFGDIKDKLQYGNITYTYWAPPGQMYRSNLTRPTILEHMFPITIEKIGAGLVAGKERIISLHSGEYSWGEKAKARAYFYDGEGKEIEGQLKTIEEKGLTTFLIEVPAGGAAVIERINDER